MYCGRPSGLRGLDLLPPTTQPVPRADWILCAPLFDGDDDATVRCLFLKSFGNHIKSAPRRNFIFTDLCFLWCLQDTFVPRHPEWNDLVVTSWDSCGDVLLFQCNIRFILYKFISIHNLYSVHRKDYQRFRNPSFLKHVMHYQWTLSMWLFRV